MFNLGTTENDTDVAVEITRSLAPHAPGAFRGLRSMTVSLREEKT